MQTTIMRGLSDFTPSDTDKRKLLQCKTIFNEVLHDQFDMIDRLYEKYQSNWWVYGGFLLSLDTENSMMGNMKITCGNFLMVVIQKILLHRPVEYLNMSIPPHSASKYVPHVYEVYYKAKILIESLRLNSQKGVDFVDCLSCISKQISRETTRNMNFSYDIASLLINEENPTLIVRFFRYAPTIPGLYDLVGTDLVRINADNEFIKKVVCSNLEVKKYIDEAFERESNLKKKKHSLFYEYQLYQEKQKVNEAYYVLTEMVLEDKVSIDVLKYILRPYLDG